MKIESPGSVRPLGAAAPGFSSDPALSSACKEAQDSIDRAVVGLSLRLAQHRNLMWLAWHEPDLYEEYLRRRGGVR